MRQIVIGCVLLIFGMSSPVAAQDHTITDVCPGLGVQARPADFPAQGIILSTWDGLAIWVYDIQRNTRYPLPNTRPCGTNCHLSQDARYITYHNVEEGAFGRMRLNGTDRTVLASYASEVDWWDVNTLLIWTGSNNAYLFSLLDGSIEWLRVPGLVNLQPGGYWGVVIEANDDGDFRRILVDTQADSAVSDTGIDLGPDEAYFNAMSWSPTGDWLAVVGPGVYDLLAERRGAELFAIRPSDAMLIQWTNLTDVYGAVRINGHAPGSISWSPDGRYIAFWVSELTGPDPATAEPSQLHVLDVTTGDLRRYCDYTTGQHTPNPPRLVWSPDGTYLSFAGVNPTTGTGSLLIALQLETGVFTALSPDPYPAMGRPDAIAWGLP
jgi:dipeptidyl aminopeptidase/acylaminoacyl peptidase